MGYKVEYVTAGYYPQMTALRDNSITAALEIWSSNIGELIVEAIDSGKVVSVGDLGLDTRETFAVAEIYPDGRLLDYPVEWGTTNVDRIAALGLPFKSVPAGSEGSLIVELKVAEEANEPLLVMFFSPHWITTEVNLHAVDLPVYYEGCYDDASAGVNPNSTYDCAWERGHVDKVTWVGMEEKWPAAHAFLSEYQMTNDVQAPLMAAIDANGEDLNTAVNEWIEGNEATWRPWVDSALN